MSVKNTGVIGLGAMGFQMGRHMVNKGFAVTGFDIAPDAVARAADVGVRIAANAAEVGSHAEVVVVMVATDKQVEDVVRRSGLLERLSPGGVSSVASSTARGTTRELGQF